VTTVDRSPLSLENISKIILETEIKSVQVDPNVFCGSNPPSGTCGCWFCPTTYYKRTNPSIMSPELFNHILTELDNGVNSGFINKNYTLWLSSYNDLLLDHHLGSRLESLREHQLRFTVLTNGIGLLRNIDLVDNYKDVIAGYLVNLPAGNALDYSRLTPNPPYIFDQILQGLQNIYNKDPDYYKDKITITVNGAYDDSHARLQLKYNLPIGDTNKQIEQLKSRFPFFKVHEARPLCDRAGLLADVEIINNSVFPIREWWRLPVGAEFAVGCNGGGESQLGRLGEWLHIGSSGDEKGARAPLYSCCQDMLETSVYGNLRDNYLVDLIYSKERVVQIDKMLKTKCLRCWFSR
jgi:hypothetical protein